MKFCLLVIPLLALACAARAELSDFVRVGDAESLSGHGFAGVAESVVLTGRVGTIEERIDAVLEDKKALSAELLEGGGEKLLTEMSNHELLRFVALDLNRATEA